MAKALDARTLDHIDRACRALVPLFAFYHIENGHTFADSIKLVLASNPMGPAASARLKVVCRERLAKIKKRKTRHAVPPSP